MARPQRRLIGESPPQDRTDQAGWLLPLPLTTPFLVFFVGFVLWFYTRADFQGFWRMLPDTLPDKKLLNLPGAVGNFKHLLPFLCVLVAAAGNGFLMLERFRLDLSGRLESFCLAYGLGCGALGSVMLLLGLFHLWRPALIWGLMGLLFLSGLAGARRWLAMPQAPQEKPAFYEQILFSFFAAAAAQNMLGCFVPETFYDGLVYHLAVPAHHWMEGGVAAMPGNLYSGIPMLMEMLYALPLSLGSTQAVHLLHWSMAVTAALTLLAFGRRILGSRRAGFFAAALFYSTPLIGIVSWRSSVDLGWTCFQLLAVYAAAVRLSGPAGKGWTVLAGTFLGFALGSKYPGWPALFVLTGTLAWGLSRQEAGWRREVLLFILAASAGMFLWPLKNLLLYRNPLYPFCHEAFSAAGAVPDWRALLADGQSRDIAAVFSSWAGLRAYLSHPWTLLAEPVHDFGSLGPLVMVALPVALFAAFTSRALRFVRASLFGLWLCWSLSTTMPRFFLPEMPLAAALLAAGVYGMIPPRRRVFAETAAVAMLAGNLFWTTTWLRAYDAYGVILGSVPPRQHLRSAHNSYAYPPYRAIEFINENLPREARILLMGESRTVYLERRSLAATSFDANPLRLWLKDCRTPADILAALRRAGITHVLQNHAEHIRLQQSRLSPFHQLGADKIRLFEDFAARHLKTVFRWRANSMFGPESLIVAEVVDAP